MSFISESSLSKSGFINEESVSIWLSSAFVPRTSVREIRILLVPEFKKNINSMDISHNPQIFSIFLDDFIFSKSI